MRAIVVCFLGLLLTMSVIQAAQTQPRTIQILADKDSQYKIDGKASPTITLQAGGEVKLIITARKAKNANRDGSIHGFALLRAKDGAKVPNWNLLLHEGTQEYVLQAPDQPGEYHVVCTVICSSGHEDMTMTVIVTS
jgi:heme/copper-type cytochrome/quinol oxidase subunit 2